jgi:hypothetical protein
VLLDAEAHQNEQDVANPGGCQGFVADKIGLNWSDLGRSWPTRLARKVELSDLIDFDSDGLLDQFPHAGDALSLGFFEFFGSIKESELRKSRAAEGRLRMPGERGKHLCFLWFQLLQNAALAPAKFPTCTPLRFPNHRNN